MKYAKFVMGNSSSGIMETPTFRIPTVDIGDRQRGRLRSKSVINCRPTAEDISRAINIAVSKEFSEVCEISSNPYDKSNTSVEIARIVHDVVYSEIELKENVL